MKARATGARIALLATSLVVALGAAELAVRLLADRSQRLVYRDHEGDPILTPDTLLGWRAAPNAAYRIWSADYDITVRTNSLGLRAAEPDAIGDEAGCRVVALGDSFVQGLTVDSEDTFATVAERTVESTTGETCHVIAAGTGGHSTEQELLFFRRDLVQYRPTLTVLFLYYNDIWCNTGLGPCHRAPLREFAFRLQDGELLWGKNPAAGSLPAELEPVAQPEPESKNGGPLLSVRRWLDDQSELFALVRRSTRVVLGMDRTRSRLPYRSMIYDKPMPRLVDVYRSSYDSELEYAWALTERLILELARETEAIGSEFALFHVPMRASLDPEEWETWLSYQQLVSAEWDPSRVRARIGSFCADNGLNCIDPSAAFREASMVDSTRPYLINDPHWSPAGHRIVGRILAEYILRSHAAVE